MSLASTFSFIYSTYNNSVQNSLSQFAITQKMDAGLPLRPLIITPNVNFAFGHSFALNLLRIGTPPFDEANSPPINLLISPLASINLPNSFGPFLNQQPSRLNVFFGSAGNKKLICKIINEKKINAIFLFLEKEPIDKEEAFHQIVSGIRQFLIGQLCPLLEAIRQFPSSKRPTLVSIFFESPNANFLQFQTSEDVQQGSIPTVKCHSEASARFSSAHALLHSFGVSYRLNIQIAILPISPTNDAIKFLMELAKIQGGNVRIHRFSMEKAIDEGNEAKEMKLNSGQIRIVRALIFGNLAYIDRAKLSEQIGENSIEKLMEAETKPGLDRDEAIEAELLAKEPTHVGWIAETDEKTLAGWESGGPAQLRENVRQNLFTPWLLRQICTKFGIHFFTFHQSKNVGEPIEANSRCAVVSHFADKLAKIDFEFDNEN